MTSKGFYFIGKLSNMSLQHQIKSDLYSFVTAERERERERRGEYLSMHMDILFFQAINIYNFTLSTILVKTS